VFALGEAKLVVFPIFRDFFIYIKHLWGVKQKDPKSHVYMLLPTEQQFKRLWKIFRPYPLPNLTQRLWKPCGQCIIDHGYLEWDHDLDIAKRVSTINLYIKQKTGY
jgi:hypothetical protein